jgi:lipoteichoic acid synthase
MFAIRALVPTMPTPASSPTTAPTNPWQRAAAMIGLPARRLLAVLSTVIVLAGFELAFKLLRIARYRYERPIGFLIRAELASSELLFLGGFFASALALAVLGERLRLPRLALVLIQLAALASFAVACLAEGYFAATGGMLDYPLWVFAWSRPHDTGPIVLSAIDRPMQVALLLGPLALLLPAWWLAADGGGGDSPRGRRLGQRLLTLLAIAVLCTLGATQIRVAAVPPDFVREPSLTLLSGYWLARHSPSQRQAEPDVPPRPSGARALRRVRESEGPPANVVFIVLESARADSTTPYAPNLHDTPVLARLAAESTLVDRAYTVVPHTSKALVAMLCGFEPRTSAELVESEPDGLPGSCLPRLLRDIGYDSAFFQVGRKRFESYGQLVRNLGFATFIGGEDLHPNGLEQINYFGYEDAAILEPSSQWLQTSMHEPFIAVYLTNASHHPYATPRRWPRQTFATRRPYDNYLNALAYVDDVMGKLLDQYRAAGLFERTLFVVLGDHGEGFDEHGMSTHDNILYEEGVRIPLLVRAPAGQARPARVSGPVNQLALVPTVLDVLGLAAEGGSYAAASIYEQADQTPLHLACFRNAHCLASLRSGHKLIYNYGDRPAQLFDLRTDPRERHNLAGEEPAQVDAWVRDLLSWESAVDRLHRQTSERTLARYLQRTPPARMQHPRQVSFGDFVELIGFDAESPRPDGVHFTCFLHVLRALPAGYHFVLRLRSGFWLSRTLDEQPVRGLYPYALWRPGDYIANFYRTDWPPAWQLMDSCLELLDADDDAVPARTEHGRVNCVPLNVLDHATQRER